MPDIGLDAKSVPLRFVDQQAVRVRLCDLHEANKLTKPQNVAL